MEFIAYLSEDEITLVGPKQTTGEHFIERAAWDQLSIESLLNRLEMDDTLQVVLDFVDENLKFEWVPKLLPWEKPGLEKRMLDKQRREGALFVKFIWLAQFQKNKDGREEQQVLICSQLSSEKLVTFFAKVESAHVSLTAIHAYSFLLKSFMFKAMLPKLRLNRQKLAQPTLFVLRQSHHSFRQVFFHFNEVRISRQIEVDQEIANEQAILTAVGHESKVAIKYLYNQKILAINAEVNFIYMDLTGQATQPLLNIFLEDVALSNWSREAFFVRDLPASLFFEVRQTNSAKIILPLFLYKVLTQYHFAYFYQQAYVTKVVGLIQTAKLVAGINLLIILGGLFYLVSSGVDTYLAYTKAQTLVDKMALYQQEKHLLQTRSQLKYDAEDIKTTVDFSETLDEIRKQGVLGFNEQELIAILSRHPHILMAELNLVRRAAIDDSEMMITLSGWVYPFKVEYLPPVQWVDAFVADLKASAHFKDVVLTREPLDRNLKKPLNVVNQTEEVVDALPFSIQLISQSISP